MDPPKIWTLPVASLSVRGTGAMRVNDGQLKGYGHKIPSVFAWAQIIAENTQTTAKTVFKKCNNWREKKMLKWSSQKTVFLSKDET